MNTDPEIAQAVRYLLEQQELVRAPKREPLPTPIASGGSVPTVFVAASNATELSKSKADLICTGADDQVVLRRAVAMMGNVKGRLILSEGIFRCVVDQAVTLQPYGVMCGLGRGATDIRIDGGSASDVFVAVGGSVLRDLTIQDNSFSAAISVHVSSGRALVENCTLNNTDGTAITAAASTPGTPSVVTGCYIAAVRGLDLSGTGEFWIVDNVVEADDVAVDCFGAAGPIWIRGNVLRGDTTAGIVGGVGGDGLHIVDNQIHSVSGAGISSGGGSSVFISGNRVEVGGDGIGVFNTPHRVTVRGNLVMAGGDGIVCGSGSWHVIEGNLIQTAGEIGIWLQGGEWYTVAGNVINEPGRQGIRMDDQDDSTVYGNVVQYAGAATTNTYDGIYLHQGSNRNLIFGNRILAKPSGNTTRYGLNIDDNTCLDNVYYGNYASLVTLFGTGAYRNAGVGSVNTMPSAGGARGDNFEL